MKSTSWPILCLALLLQSFTWVASAQEMAAPPEGSAASTPPAASETTPAPAAATAGDLPKVDTNAAAATPEIGPEASPGAKAAQMELIKRQELVFTANQAIVDGEKLFKAGQLDAAAERFKYALDNLPSGGTSAASYQKAASDLGVVYVAQGDAAFKAKSYDVALKSYQQAVDLVPSNSTYRSRLSNAKERIAAMERSSRDVRGTENNPALTPEFREKLTAIQKLFFEGDRLYDTGQYDAAQNRYMQIIALDPYNKAARGKLDRLEQTRTRAAEKMRDTTRANAMYQVTADWSQSVPTDYSKQGKQKQTSEGGESKLARMTKKLQTMRIPSLNFNQADIQTVVQVLTAKSRELDPTHEGINFVLDSGVAAPDAPKPAAGGADAGAAAAPAAPVAIPPVTISLQDVPMIEALHFISSITTLQVNIEEYAVLLLPPNAASSVLQTRTFAVPPGFFEGGLKPNAAKPGSTETTKVDTIKIDVKQQLIDKGISFPDGATAAFLSGSSRLVVKNTPDQLDVIDALIRASNVETPQVEIETRMAEFTDDQLKALTFQYNQYITVSTTGAFGYPNPLVNVRHAGSTALRDANTGIIPNSLDSVLQSTTGGSNFLTGGQLSNPATNTIGIGGVIGGNALSVIINLVDNMKGVDLLSAPKVTAKNRTRAKVEIVRELRYPSEYERPTINSTPFAMAHIVPSGFLGSNPDGISTVYLGLPSTPRQFTVKPIGVTMEVTPTTYPDQRIDLELQPEVVDFEGFINYGQPIRVRSDALTPAANQQGEIDTTSIVNEPVFNIRSVTTKVQVLDGQTVVIGGLIREDRQMINDKVPFFGDLPLVGRAFQSKVEKSVKRNLMIFVTARLVKSDGQSLYNQDLAAATAQDGTNGQ